MGKYTVPNFTHSFKEFLLMWLCAWFGLIESIVGILTFGYILLSLKLKAVTWLARYRYKHSAEWKEGSIV